MKGRKSKQCCCAVSGDCLTCTDTGCTWTVQSGSFAYSAGEWTGSVGAIQYTDLGYPWAGANFSDLSHTRAAAIIRLNDGDWVRIIGDIYISGATFRYSWIGIRKDENGKVYMNTGRIGNTPTDSPGALAGNLTRSVGCDHEKLLGCFTGEIEVLVEACFVGGWAVSITPGPYVYGRAPLFAGTISNTTQGNPSTHPTALGMMIVSGNPGIQSFAATVAKVGASCQYCGAENSSDYCRECLPGSTPPYIDVTFPVFSTEGPTCNPPCSSLSNATLRLFPYTDSSGTPWKCSYSVTTNGMCFSRIPVFGGYSDSILVFLSLDHIAEDLGSYLEMSIRAVGGTQRITWQTDTTVPNGPSRLGPIPIGEHGVYDDDFDSYDCSCYVNGRNWEVRSNDWLYLNTVCRAMGPVMTSCPVRVIA